jgi:hypothetical protein
MGSGGDQRLFVEGGKAPFEQGCPFARAVLRLVIAAHDDHQPPPAPLGRADQTIAGLVGEPGLDPVGPGHDAIERIVVLLGNAVPGHRVAAIEPRVKIRMAGDERGGQRRQIGGGNIGPAFVHPAIGGVVMGVAHAQRAGLCVHHRGEAGHAPGDPFGQHDAGIVGRNRDDPFEKVRCAGPAVVVEEHRAAHAVPLAERLGPHDEGRVEVELALRGQLESDVAGHDLGERGGHEAAVRLPLEQHAPRIDIDQQRDRRDHFGRMGRISRNSRACGQCRACCHDRRKRQGKSWHSPGTGENGDQMAQEKPR